MVRVPASAPGEPWESTAGAPRVLLASKANGERSRAVNLPMENSIIRCLGQNWKSAFRFGV